MLARQTLGGDENTIYRSTVGCLFVGDGGVGKSELIHCYTRARPKSDRREIDRRVLQTRVQINGLDCRVRLVDYSVTVLDRLEHFGYRIVRDNPDVVLLCFSLVDRTSLESVRGRWSSFVRKECPSLPVILVGTKSDIRDKTSHTEETSHISNGEGLDMAMEIGAVQYVECSAATHDNIVTLVDTAIREAVKANAELLPYKSKCSIL